MTTFSNRIKEITAGFYLSHTFNGHTYVIPPLPPPTTLSFPLDCSSHFFPSACQLQLQAITGKCPGRRPACFVRADTVASAQSNHTSRHTINCCLTGGVHLFSRRVMGLSGKDNRARSTTGPAPQHRSPCRSTDTVEGWRCFVLQCTLRIKEK